MGELLYSGNRRASWGLSVLIDLALVCGGVTASTTDGLVGWWRFDAASGSKVIDSSGNGHDGAISGATRTHGRDGRALLFDGVDDYVSLPAGVFSGVADEITFSLWHYGAPDTHLAARHYLLDASDDRGRTIFGQVILPGAKIQFNAGEHVNNTAPSASVYEGRWNSWIFTKDRKAGEMKLFVNGQLFLRATGKDKPMNGVTQVRVGGRCGDKSFYHGAIDDLRVYDRVLTATEIAALAGVKMRRDPAGSGAKVPMPPTGRVADSGDSVSKASATGSFPADRAFDVDPYPTLRWNAGSRAAKTVGHDLYLGTDKALVAGRDKSVLVGRFDGGSHAPGMLTLATTYYWAVDEINGSRSGGTGKGEVWKFVTRNSREGYVADILFDGGSGVTATKPSDVPAVAMLGYSVENLYDGKQTSKVMTGVYEGDLRDDNGLLLYPDREPRYRLMMVFGGNTRNHVAAVGKEGAKNIHDFWANGGGYCGSCAGAWCAQRKNFNTCKLSQHGAVTGGGRVSLTLPDGKTPLMHCVTPDGEDPATWYWKEEKPLPRSPVADLYPEGFGDHKVFGFRMAGGPKVVPWDSWDEHAEALFLYDITLVLEGEDKEAFFKAMDDPFDISDPLGLLRNRLPESNSRQVKSQNAAAVWAYKTGDTCGRSVLSGGHPENDTKIGEMRYVMASIFRYSHSGFGRHTVKAALADGVARRMDDNDSPGHEKIGDKQYHHFTIEVPERTPSLEVVLDGTKHDMNLYAKRGDFAFKGERGVVSAANGADSDETLVVENPEAGTWYIGVKCNTGIRTNATYPKLFKNYTGRYELLNGLAYSIRAATGKRE